MKILKAFSVLVLLVAFAGCTQTKFNRGVDTIPGDFVHHAKYDIEKFKSLNDDIGRKLENSYQKAVDISYDIKRWTTREWEKSCDGVKWVVVQIGHEFSVLEGAADYIKSRFNRIGPKVKGLWRDTYRLISYELAVTCELDDEVKRQMRKEFARISGAKEGLTRFMRNRRHEFGSLIVFVKRLYKNETEKGSEALQQIKDFFVKDVNP